jgi:diguanylate cyclase (GGDEF)-like protein
MQTDGWALMIECETGIEKERLDALSRMELLGTPAEEAFGPVVRLAKSMLETPIVLVSLIDENRQWHISNQDMVAGGSPCNFAFCDRTIRNREPTIVEDTLLDDRFSDNPFVAGEPGIRFYAGVPLRTRDGHSIGTLSAIDFKPRTISGKQINVLEDLAQLVVDDLELRLIATTDSLTGAMTRRALLEVARRDIALARRKSFDLSCAILDIDHFKSVNDSLGHAAGDLVLQEIVKMCRRSLRTSDYIGRIGGEEFAIILQDTDETTAIIAVERMRSGIENLAIEFAGKAIPVTASFGVAGLTPAIGSFDDLLREADTAMFVAKANGRNQIVGSNEVERAVNAA